jgi:uncharacterized heparinase superfamily protein
MHFYIKYFVCFAQLNPFKAQKEYARLKAMQKFRLNTALLEKTSLYGFTLRGKVAPELISTPMDLWPGDFQVAKYMLSGDYVTDAQVIPASDIFQFLAEPQKCPKELLCRLHGFEWLRDLRSVSTNQSRKLVREMIEHWIDSNHSWSKKSWLSPSWRPHIIGHRLSSWISLFDFFGTSADDAFRHKVLISICQQYQHLQRVWGRSKNIFYNFLALKGLIFCAATLPKQKAKIPIYVKLLEKNLKRQIMPDGGHMSRSPIVQVHLLKDLIDIRSLITNNKEEQQVIQSTIQSIAPIVRLFRHGDGGLTHFKGDVDMGLFPYLARSTTGALVDTALSLSDVRGRPSGRADYMGYERCSNKTGLLLLNTKVSLASYNLAEPLDQGVNILDFEWSLGRQRIIEKGDIVIQTSPCEFVKLHNQTAGHLSIRRHSENQLDYVAAHYDQFFDGLSYNHQRELYMPNEEGVLKGHDTVALTEKAVVAVRFCLHEGIAAEVQPNKTVRLTIKESTKKTKLTQKTCMLTANGYDDILCEALGAEGSMAIYLVTYLVPNAPKTLKWAFQMEGMVKAK